MKKIYQDRTMGKVNWKGRKGQVLKKQNILYQPNIGLEDQQHFDQSKY